MATLSSPKCLNCLRNYSFSQAGLQPRILSCRHSICRQCVVKLLRSQKEEITCPKCKGATIIPKGDTKLQCMPVNLYLVGLACASVKQQINPFNHKLEFRTKEQSEKVKYEARELKGGRPPCVSCKETAAECLCQQCNISVCDSCFTTIHKGQGNKTHAKVSLVNDTVYGCPEHENMPREFFCQDDKEPICAKCGLTGSHKGHNILHIQEKNSEVYKELQPAVDSAKSMLKKLYYSKEVVQKEELEVISEQDKIRQEIQDAYAQFFAELQISLSAMEETVLDATTDQLENLSKIKNNINSNICRLTTVMEDVQPGLKDKSKAPSNLTEIISILRGASSLPWCLVQDKKEDPMVKFDPGKLDISAKVDVNVVNLHTLKTTEEAPEDMRNPTVSDKILEQCRLFGGKSQKKKKPIGPDHVRILQKEGILPKDLTEIKEKTPRPKLDLKKNTQRQYVRVVHIRNPACFYIHRQVELPRLERIMKSLGNICESITDFRQHLPDPIQAGTKCCCKFDDGQWYRALVKSVPDEVAGVLSVASPDDIFQSDDDDQLKVEVVYIDYGNTQWVPVSQLVKLKPKFEKEPAFAVACALYDIIPPDKKSKWPKESAEAFATMVASQDVPLVMSTHGEVNDFLQVDLHKSPNSSVADDAPISIRDALIFLEQASFINDTPSPLTPKSPVPPRKYFPPELPCEGDSVSVSICNIVDPHHFWVQEKGVMEASLHKLMEDLQTAYRKRSNIEWTVLCPQLDMICVAKYANDKKWYRAQIIGIPGKQHVEVLYVDYGNTATLKCTQIRKISENFLKLPIMALPCKLADVAPKVPDEGWSEDAILYFSHMISFKPVELHIYSDKDQFMSVLAFDISEEEKVNMNALLVQSGHARSAGPASFIPEMLRPTASTSTKPSPAAKQGPISEPSRAKKKEMYTAVHVSNVESPSCIYLQLSTASTDGLDSLLEAMTLHYKDTEPDMEHEWKEKDPCAALLVREGVWCRGGIVSFLPENNMVVMFMDYGNKEILSLQNIRPLEEKFKEEPPFAICCHVTGILPAGGKDWTQTASQFLKDKLSDLDCYINQKGDAEDGSLPVDLLYELTGQEMIDRNTEDELDSISELLIKEGLALRDRKKTTPAQSPKAKPGVTTRAAQSPRAKNPVNGGTTSPLRGKASVSQVSESDASDVKLTEDSVEDSVKHSTPENRLTREAADISSDSPQFTTPASGKTATSSGSSSPREKRSKKRGQTAKKLDIAISPTLDMTKSSPSDGADKTENRGTDSQKDVTDIHTASLEQTETPIINDSGDSGIVNTDHGNVEGTSVDGLDILKDSDRSREKSDDATITDDSVTHHPDDIRRIELSGGDSLMVNGLSVDTQRKEDSANVLPHVPASGTEVNVSSEEGEEMEDLMYLPPVLPEKEQMVIVVTFVSNDGLIYGLEMDKFSVFQSMMEEMQEYFKTRQQALPPTTLKLNQPVCARFSADNQWYRAIVINVMPDAAEVRYIDFGNTEVVPLNEIDIRPFQTDLPQQSISCQLYGIMPISPDRTWPANAVQVLAQMITEQTCTLTVKEVCETNKPVVVDLFLPSGDSASDLLVKHGLMTRVKASHQSQGGGVDDDDDYGEEIFDEDDEYFDSSECSKISNQEMLREFAPIQYQPDSGVLNPMVLLGQQSGGVNPVKSLFKPLQFPLGWIEFLAEVPCIESPDLVYLQYSTTFRDGPYQDHDLMLIYEKFIKLHADVNKLAHTFPDIEVPKPGMPCLAHYKSDKQWYRGEILAVEGGPDMYCSVRFVDYGTVESLPLERICHLPEKYLELPTQCRLCKIEGLKPPSVIPPGFPVSQNSNWPVATSNAMLQLIKNKIFLAQILEDGPIPVISLYSTQFINGGIQRGPPMFLSLIETGLADVGVGFSGYTWDKPSYSQ